MNNLAFLPLLVLFLLGCDQAQQDRIADRANQLIDPQAHCVARLDKFLNGVYRTQLKASTVGMESGNLPQMISAAQSLLITHDSANLSDCPPEITSSMNEARHSMNEILTIFIQARDNPFSLPQTDTMKAAGQRWNNSLQRLANYMQSYDSDALIDLKKYR